MHLNFEWLAENYDALRRVAYALMRRERRRKEHTLQATELVDEVVAALKEKEVDNPLRYVRKMMMNHLTKHARRRIAEKRDSRKRVELTDVKLTNVFTPGGESLETVLAVRIALERYRKVRERPARVLDMKYLAGMKLNEIAEELGVSLATVKNDLANGEAWLRAQLEGLHGK